MKRPQAAVAEFRSNNMTGWNQTHHLGSMYFRGEKTEDLFANLSCSFFYRAGNLM